jgi:hypothetical protein
VKELSDGRKGRNGIGNARCSAALMPSNSTSNVGTGIVVVSNDAASRGPVTCWHGHRFIGDHGVLVRDWAEKHVHRLLKDNLMNCGSWSHINITVDINRQIDK